MKSSQKRVKVEALGRGSGTIYRRVNDGAFEHTYWDSEAKRQVTKTLLAKNKTAARREAQGRVGKIASGEMVAPSAMTFDQLAEAAFDSFEAMVKRGERSEQSLLDFKARYRTHIKPRIGSARAQSITRARALKLLDELRRSDASSATVATAWKMVVWVCNFGRDIGVIDIDLRLPRGKRITVENVRTVRILTPAEAEKVIAATPERWRLLVEAAHLTGARVSELLGLRFSDCDLHAGTIHINGQLNRQGGRTRPKTKNSVRTIPISDALRLKLLTAYNESEDRTYIFGADTVPSGRYRLAARGLEGAIKNAGIKFDPERERVSFHSFRHGVASNLIRRGVDPQRVADHLGDDLATVIKSYVQTVRTDADENLGEMLAQAV
jgi:integrase